jgi:UDP-N-acetylglucosamine 2-epimerase (non-hydrolysing)
MMKILIIFGTRPEAVKLAPLIWEIKKNSHIFNLKICLTGQHREMLYPFLKNLNLKASYDLRVMQKDQTLSQLTEKIIFGVDKIFKKDRPDWIIVQGDTTTALLASLAAYYQKIKIIHLEAGLRTNDRYNPFPEEMNRRLITRLADIHLAPTKQAAENLAQEGIDKKNIFVTGNTVIDTLLWLNKKIEKNNCDKRFANFFKNKYGIAFDDKKIILVTGHRRESFGQDLKDICLAVKDIALKRKDVVIIYAVHLNPQVQKTVYQILKNIPRVHLIPPLDYFSFIWLMKKSFLILTDSGGVQEEAPYLRKPLLIIRKKTERSEGIRLGVAKLVGTTRNIVEKNIILLLDRKNIYLQMAKKTFPYGDGKSAQRIIKILKSKK